MASFLNSIAFACGPFLRSLYLQLVLGYSPMKQAALNPDGILIFILSPSAVGFRQNRQPGFNLFRPGGECIALFLVLHAQPAFFLQRDISQFGLVRHRDIAVCFANVSSSWFVRLSEGNCQRHQHDPQPDRQRAQCAFSCC